MLFCYWKFAVGLELTRPFNPAVIRITLESPARKYQAKEDRENRELEALTGTSEGATLVHPVNYVIFSVLLPSQKRSPREP